MMTERFIAFIQLGKPFLKVGLLFTYRVAYKSVSKADDHTLMDNRRSDSRLILHFLF